MAITLSQFAVAFSGTVSSLNALFSSAVTAGNSIIATVGHFSIGGATFSTVIDPVNTAAYVRRVYSTMSNASDTAAHLIVLDNLNISSGRAGSTFRVSVNVSGASGLSLFISEWSGGPFTVGSTASANGTSTGPVAGAVTASSTPMLFFGASIVNSTAQYRSTVVGTGNFITTVDAANAGQIMNVIRSTNTSSLQQNIQHAMTASTRWLAGVVVYMGLGAGGAAARPFVDGFPLFGCV